MRRFYRLMEDMTVSDRWHVGEIESDGDSVSDALWTGRRWTNGQDLHGSVSHAGRQLDFFLTSFAVPIATVRLAGAVAGVAGADLQRIPVLIDNATGYEVLNALRVIKCVDEQRSEFIKWTKDDHRADKAGQYRSVTRLLLDAKLVPEHAQIFRIDGWKVCLIVSEAVKGVMEEVGCFGASFELVTS